MSIEQDVNAIAADWGNTEQLDLGGWFLMARARAVEDPLPMLPGIHLNLGAGFRPIGDAVSLDRERGWDADREPIPYGNGEVTGIWAHAFLGYVERPLNVLAECHRVLAPGGVLNIVEPHAMSALWHEDVQRRNRFTEETWKNLFSNKFWDPQAGLAVERFQFRIHTCFIMGVVWRNLSLFTQLVKG